MNAIWRCPKCKNPLFLSDSSWICKGNHSYDISKKGYVHLLLANQKHQDNSGDSKESMEARIRFLQKGFYQVLEHRLIELFQQYLTKEFPLSFVDLACGEGNYTCKIHTNLQNSGFLIHTYGVDLSKSAILSCGHKKRVQQLTNIDFAIGNLSYLPILDQSVDIALNCFAKFFPEEFARILKENGILIRVLPGRKHLWEMKELLYTTPYENEREVFEGKEFHSILDEEIEDHISLSQEDLHDLIVMTPYFYKTNPLSLQKLLSLSSMDVTISFHVQVLQKQ